MKSSAARLVVVAPWLQGGGAQAAMLETVRRVGTTPSTLIVIFRGNRDFEPVRNVFHEIIFLDCAKTPSGIISAAYKLRRLLGERDRVYSLMRGSHVVLGLLPRKLLRGFDLIATFHQSPSEDRRSPVSRLEDLPIRRLMRFTRFVSAPSQRAIQELRAARVLGPEQGVLVENPVRDFNDPTVERIREPGQPLRLLLAGRLDEQKGILDLEELLNSVHQPVSVLVAGDGPLLEVVQALEQNPWEHSVTALGYQTEIQQSIDDCDYLFLPSRFELNPVVVWESWSRGRSVIASDIDAFRDLQASGPIYLYHSAFDLDQLLRRLSVHAGTDYHQALDAAAGADSGNSLVRALRGRTQRAD